MVCLDQLYISNKKYAIRLDYQNENLGLLEKTPILKFEKVFKHCINSNEHSLFYEVRLENGLLKKYILSDKNSGNTLKLKEVNYQKRIDLYNSKKGLIARADISSNMGDITVAENEKIRDLQEEADFLETVFFRNYIENYLFSKDEEIVLFNCDEKKIEFFNKEGKLVNWVEMQFEPVINAGFKAIISDKETGVFYSIFKESGKFKLGQIDLKTGKITLKTSIEASTIKKAEIIRGRLFLLGIPKNVKGVSKYQFLSKNIF